MARRIWPLGAAGRAALAAVVAGAMIAVAACGSHMAAGHLASAGDPGAAPVPGGKASAGVALCMDIPKLTSVAVGRTMALHAFQPGLVLRRGVTIRGPLRVRELPGAVPRLVAARVRRRQAPVPAGHRPGERLPGRHGRGPGADSALGGVLAHSTQGRGLRTPAGREPVRRDQPLRSAGRGSSPGARRAAPDRTGRISYWPGTGWWPGCCGSPRR